MIDGRLGRRSSLIRMIMVVPVRLKVHWRRFVHDRRVSPAQPLGAKVTVEREVGVSRRGGNTVITAQGHCVAGAQGVEAWRDTVIMGRRDPAGRGGDRGWGGGL